MNMVERNNLEIYVTLDEERETTRGNSRAIVLPVSLPVYANYTRNGPPPSYEECQDLNTPPPSYESLFGRVKELEKRSNGVCDFFKNVLLLLFGTGGFTLMIGVTVVVPVLMIVIGSLKMDECPGGKFIPTYLIVGGSLGVLKNVANSITQLRSLTREDEPEPLPWHRRFHFTTILNFFLTSWFITGCVFVYRIYEPNYADRSDPRYCDYTLYNFTFWLVTSAFVTAGVLSTCLCFLSVLTVILQRYHVPISDE